MKYINTFNDFLFENNRANVYHVTSFRSIEGILKYDHLRPSSEIKFKNKWAFLGISTTRNKSFKISDNPITLELNMNKIKHQYKVLPEDYLGKQKDYKSKSHPDRHLRTKEFEEFIITKTGLPLSKYLISIDINEYLINDIIKIITNKIENSNKHFIIFYLESCVERLNIIINYCKEYNIKITPNIKRLENILIDITEYIQENK